MSEIQERYHDYKLRRLREERDMNDWHEYTGPGSMHAQKIEKWDRRFMEMAQMVSTWSKDPSSKIGAVVFLLPVIMAFLVVSQIQKIG